MISFKPQMVKLQIGLEKDISRLYFEYSERFKEQREFWEEIGRDEKKHARLIMEMSNNFKDASSYFNRNRISEAALRDQIKMVEGERKRLRKDNVSLKEALETACKIEDSLLESAFYTTFANDPEEIIKTIALIRSEEEKHARDIKRLLTGRQEEAGS